MNDELETFVPLKFKRYGGRRLASTPKHNTTLLEWVGRAFYWQHLIDTRKVSSGRQLARQEGIDQSIVNEMLRLTLLAPDLIEQLMAGQQPRSLTVAQFQRNRLPVEWQAQRTLFTRFD